MTGYQQGATATLLVQFYAYAGGPAADVTGLTITISPTGGGAAVLGPTSTGVVHESTGLYSYAWAIDIDQTVGTYVVLWEADGGVTAAETVEVIASGANGWEPDYASVSELKAYLRIDDNDDDVQLALAVTAASRAVDRHCGRQFGQVTAAEARRYTAVWDRRWCRWLVDADDLGDDTGLTVAVDAGSITGYELEPANAAGKGRPWTRIVVDADSTVQPTSTRHGVTVTGLWGWSSVPDPVKQATLLQASRLFNRRDSPYGIAGSPTEGSELRLLAKVDPDVAVVLRPYLRMRVVA